MSQQSFVSDKLLWPLLVALLAGIVLLAVEYRTSFFQKAVIGNLPPMLSSNNPQSLDSSGNSPRQAKYPCSVLIKQSQVDAWKIGQTYVPTVHKFIRQFDAMRVDDAGAFVAGSSIPNGVLVATNFDERDRSKWAEYKVIPIVHSRSWGLFQTTVDYTAPRPGACMTVVP